MELRSDIKRRLRSARDFLGLIDTLEQEAEAVESSSERSQRFFELAEACEEIFLRKDRAMANYQKAFKLNQQNTLALRRARAIYREMANLDMVAKLCEMELKLAQDGGRKAEIFGELGQALLELRERDRAIDCLETAFSVRSDDAAALESLQAAQGHRDGWQKAIARFTKEADKGDSQTAARMWLRIARIHWLESDESEGCEEALRKVIANDPQNEAANFLLELLLSKRKDFDAIVLLHDRRAHAAPEEDQAALYRRFASVWAVRWNDVARSAAFYRKALESYYADGIDGFPGHIAAFDFVRGTSAAPDDWERVLSLAELGLRAKIDDSEKGILAAQAGRMAWKQMKDNAKAKIFFARAKQWVPELDELREFEKEAGSVTATTPAAAPQPLPVASQPAPAREKKVETTERARVEEPVMGITTAIPKVVVPDESYDDKVQALIDAAKAAEGQGVEKGIDAWRKVVAAAADKRRPRRELGRLYRKAERWNALIEVLKEEAERTSGDDKVAVLFEMVEVYKERLRLDVMVVNTFNQILQLQPKNLAALDTLAAQYESMKRWPDLIGVLQKRAPLTADTSERVQLHIRIATLFQEKFSNQAEAIKAFEAALEIDPGNELALGYLKQAYEKRRDWEKLIGVHMREIERAPESERPVKFVEVAKLASEKLKKPSVSIDLWKKVLSVDPTHAEALGELEKLYEREKNWDELAAVLERQVEVSQSKGQTLQKLGILYTDKTKAPDKAISAWQRLLQVEPENRRAQDS